MLIPALTLAILSAGDFAIRLESKNGRSHWSQSVQIQGTGAGADVLWLVTTTPQSTLKRGKLSAQEVRRLWGALGALKWAKVTSVSNTAEMHATSHVVSLHRDGTSAEFSLLGGCLCPSRGDSGTGFGESAACGCRQQSVIDELEATAAAAATADEAPTEWVSPPQVSGEGPTEPASCDVYTEGLLAREVPRCLLGRRVARCFPTSRAGVSFCPSEPGSSEGRRVQSEFRGSELHAPWALQLAGGAICVEPEKPTPARARPGHPEPGDRREPAKVQFVCSDSRSVLEVKGESPGRPWLAQVERARGPTLLVPIVRAFMLAAPPPMRAP